MIKIRYRDPNELSPGLHAAVECRGRSTTVYLLAGLSGAERRAALRRLRMAARRGYGPRLPAPQMALAHLGDRIRTTLVQAGSVLRLHPAGSTVPVMLLSAGAVAFLAVSAVSMRIGPHTDSGDSLPIISAIAAPGPGQSPKPTDRTTSHPDRGSPGSQGFSGSAGSAYRQAYAGGSASGDDDVPSGSPSPTPGASTPTSTPSPTATPTSTPTTASSSPTPTSSPSTVQPAPTPTSSNGAGP
jgi:hypothetical protein